MKITNKIPKYDERMHSKLINNGWILTKEPTRFINTLFLSVPFMFINALISIWIMNCFSTVSLKEFGITPNLITININISTIFFILLFLIIHEFIHLILIPNVIKSKNTCIGITWFGAFVTTEEIISKSRFLLITLAPFIIISVILPIVLGMFGTLTTTMKFIILLNAAASSVDSLTFLMIALQVPKYGILKNNGNKTYWKHKIC